MRRAGSCTTCANTLWVNGKPTPLQPGTGVWRSGYAFQYTDGGRFSIWRVADGTATALQNWTLTFNVVPGGPNLLRVVSHGDGRFLFFINDLRVPVASVSDRTLAGGVVAASPRRAPRRRPPTASSSTTPGSGRASFKRDEDFEVSREQRRLNEEANRNPRGRFAFAPE